jgi:uncharacterized protein (TIGR02453 family)
LRSIYEDKPFLYSTEGMFIGFGIWSPDKNALRKMRSEIAYNNDDLFKIIHKDSFKESFGTIIGESLKRPPQGFYPHSANIELLKLKQYMIMKNFSDEEVLSNNFIEEVMKAYQEGLPF